MAREASRRWLIVSAGVVVLVVAAVAFVLPRGETSATSDAFTTAFVKWQAPTTGATAVSYVVRIQDLQDASEDTFHVAAQADAEQSFAFTQARSGHEYRACIAGVDAQGRQGPWSGWSPVHRGATESR